MTDQPMPTPNNGPDISELVIARLRERREQGIATYKTTLQPNNGRDALRDLLEELLDAAQYCEQVRYERDQRAKLLPGHPSDEALRSAALAYIGYL